MRKPQIGSTWDFACRCGRIEAEFQSVIGCDRNIQYKSSVVGRHRVSHVGARSRHDGVCFDRVEPAFQRYVVNPVPNRHEIWSLRHPSRRMVRGKILRIILALEATIGWSTDDWAHTNQSDAT